MHANLTAAIRDKDKPGIGWHLAANIRTRHPVMTEKIVQRGNLITIHFDRGRGVQIRIQPPRASRGGGRTHDRSLPHGSIAQSRFQLEGGDQQFMVGAAQTDTILQVQRRMPDRTG